MISLYSGTPGSGKSYHATKILYERMQCGGGIIANFPVSVPDGLKPRESLRVSYWDNSEIVPIRFFAYAQKYHKEGIEGQTLVVVDEAQVVWNSRSFTDRHRMEWVKFFSQHRKLGFDILLIAQNDRMIDKQMRMLIEYEVKHRKLNNYGVGGSLLSLVTGMSTWFVAIEYWYGGNKLRLGSEMIRYSKRIASLYDSYRMFSGGMETVQGLGDALASADVNLVALPGRKHAKMLSGSFDLESSSTPPGVPDLESSSTPPGVPDLESSSTPPGVPEQIKQIYLSLKRELAPGLSLLLRRTKSDHLFNRGDPL